MEIFTGATGTHELAGLTLLTLLRRLRRRRRGDHVAVLMTTRQTPLFQSSIRFVKSSNDDLRDDTKCCDEDPESQKVNSASDHFGDLKC